MSINCLVIGESGTGKSTSIKSLDPSKTAIIQAVGKPLPFRNRFQVRVAHNIQDAIDIMHRADSAGRRIIILDDVQYWMAGEFMNRVKEKGFDKFNDIGGNMWKLLQASLGLSQDTRVYLLWHAEYHADGRIKAKTIGKVIDEKVTLEGMFSIVVRTFVRDGQYGFFTQNQGNDTTKSPADMFPKETIENNLALVDAAICDFYQISEGPEQQQQPQDQAQKSKGNLDGEVVNGSSKVPPLTASEQSTLDQAAEVF